MLLFPNFFSCLKLFLSKYFYFDYLHTHSLRDIRILQSKPLFRGKVKSNKGWVFALVHTCVCPQSLSRVCLFETPCTTARQGPLSMGFPRQEYWSGLPFPSLGVFLTQGSNPGLLWLRQAGSLPLATG